MHRSNVMWVQIGIYILIVFFRFAAFGVYGFMIDDANMSIEPEIIRFGVDLAVMGIGMILGASTIVGFKALDCYGKPFVIWLALLAGLFIVTYFIFIFLRNNSFNDIMEHPKLLTLYIVEIITGGMCLYLGGIITATAHKQGV